VGRKFDFTCELALQNVPRDSGVWLSVGSEADGLKPVMPKETRLQCCTAGREYPHINIIDISAWQHKLFDVCLTSKTS